MGCNCGKGGAVVRQVGQQDQPAGAPIRTRTRVMFHVLPPPEDRESEGVSFTNLYEARIALGQRPGWRLEPRREPVAG